MQAGARHSMRVRAVRGVARVQTRERASIAKRQRRRSSDADK